MTIFIQR